MTYREEERTYYQIVWELVTQKKNANVRQIFGKREKQMTDKK